MCIEQKGCRESSSPASRSFQTIIWLDILKQCGRTSVGWAADISGKLSTFVESLFVLLDKSTIEANKGS